MKIGQTVQKLPHFVLIQDGGRRHLGFHYGVSGGTTVILFHDMYFDFKFDGNRLISSKVTAVLQNIDLAGISAYRGVLG